MRLNFRTFRLYLFFSLILIALAACTSEKPFASTLFAALKPATPSGKLIYLHEHSLHELNLATRQTTDLSAASDFLKQKGTGFYLSLTPDGKILVFDGYDPLMGCSTFRRIYICEETGPNGFFTYDLSLSAVNLIRPFTLSNISLSPDGSQLAFTVLEYETTDYQVHLKISPIGGGVPTSLSNGHVVDSAPSWSPDGEWIAFVRSHSPNPDAAPCTPTPGLFDSCTLPYPGLYLIHPDGSGYHKLLDNIRQFYAPYNQPAWSNDGRTLAVIAGDQIPQVTLVNIGDGSTKIIQDLAPSSIPVWSPTQRLLAFTIGGVEDTDSYILLYDDSTSSWRVLAQGASPVWSPDGQWLAYLDVKVNEPNQLKVISLDGKTLVDLGVSDVSAKPIWVK